MLNLVRSRLNPFCLLFAVLQEISLLTPASVLAQDLDRRVLRPPSAFRELDINLRSELDRRGCTIPVNLPVSSNVLRGQFAKPGQFDWAVLCSSKHVTRLLVFWDGSPQNPTELSVFPNRNGVSEWYIRPVGKDFIEQHYRAYGGPKPPPIDHDGIESGGEHVSTVFYRYRGKWLQLQGAD
jgi:hypothetical protein